MKKTTQEQAIFSVVNHLSQKFGKRYFINEKDVELFFSTIKYIEATPSSIYQYRRLQRIADKRKDRIRNLEYDMRNILYRLESTIYQNDEDNDSNWNIIKYLKERYGFK